MARTVCFSHRCVPVDARSGSRGLARLPGVRPVANEIRQMDHDSIIILHLVLVFAAIVVGGLVNIANSPKRRTSFHRPPEFSGRSQIEASIRDEASELPRDPPDVALVQPPPKEEGVIQVGDTVIYAFRKLPTRQITVTIVSGRANDAASRILNPAHPLASAMLTARDIVKVCKPGDDVSRGTQTD